MVFHDIADAYPNDTDIVISFTLTTQLPQEANLISNVRYGEKISSDRIGIFKVPYVSPCDILSFQWVDESDSSNEGGVHDVGTVIFKGMNSNKYHSN